MAGYSREQVNRSAAQLGTLPYFDHLNRLTALEQLLRSNGQWFYPTRGS
jgi:hypothetical protein